jgi:hypothetical protein
MIDFHLSPAEARLLVNSLAYNLEFASLESSARKRMLLLKGKITNEILDDRKEKEIDLKFEQERQ